MIDTNKVVRQFLLGDAALTGLVSTRIMCPRIRENTTLPAVSYFTRGGKALPIVKGIVSPSVQFMCWAQTPVAAREVYGALFDALQGIGGYYNAFTPVTVEGNTHNILSVAEEVQGQDLQDTTSNYYYVLTFFQFKIQL